MSQTNYGTLSTSPSLPSRSPSSRSPSYQGSIDQKKNDQKRRSAGLQAKKVPSAKIGRCHPKGLCYRYLVLTLACMMPFGSYFCYDAVGALKPYFTVGMDDALGFDDTQFNMLFSVYSWPNTILVFFGGLFIDKVGVRTSSLLFLSFIVSGQVLLVTALRLPAEWRYYGMIFGRFVFGLGGESLVVAQNAIIAQWFSGKELALSFGIAISISRLGTVAAYNLSPFLASKFSLTFCLTFGVGLICVSILCCFGFIFLDRRAEQIETRPPLLTDEMHLRDVMEFPLLFWLLCIICAAFYAGCQPFIQNTGGFLNLYFNYSAGQASTVAGVPYDVSLFLMPLFGIYMDVFGWAAYTILFACFIMIPCQLAFTYTDITPFLPLVGVGIAYSIIASILWSCIPIVVDISRVGTALGVLSALLNMGLALASIAVGVLNTYHTGDTMYAPFHRTMRFFLINSACATAGSVALNYLDYRLKGKLNVKQAIKETLEEEFLLRKRSSSQDPMTPRSHMMIRMSYLHKIGIFRPR